MAHKFSFKSALVALLFVSAPLTYGETFVAHDDSFRLDDTAGWQEASPITIDGVLALEKGKSRVDIRRTECTNETCLDQLINQDLAEIKSKNMTVTPNATTGQEINRVEFATGEPFFYIHFSKGASRFSAGYFLINARVYSVLGKNVVYEEVDPLFALVSPLAKAPQDTPAADESDLAEKRSYETEMTPEVEADGAEEISLILDGQTAQADAGDAPALATAAKSPSRWRKVTPAKLKYYAVRASRKIKKAYEEGAVCTFISPQMPLYLRSFGRMFDAAVLFVFCFAVLLLTTAVLRLIIPVRRLRQPVNSHSSYPIRIRRLYGTPAIVCRARDNQGNTLIALASRWDSLFFFTGLMLLACDVLFLAGTSLSEQLRILPLTDAVYAAVYQWGALGLAAGIFLVLLGYVWTQFTQKEVLLFDCKGKKVAVILQKGFWKENYQVYFARSKETLFVKRLGGFWRRHYQLFNETDALIADVKERSVFRALLRKFTGHLWGLLRADYDIAGATESRGGLESTHGTSSRFVCTMDKPEAVESRDLLTLSLLIAIRDRDKWYPWIG